MLLQPPRGNPPLPVQALASTGCAETDVAIRTIGRHLGNVSANPCTLDLTELRLLGAQLDWMDSACSEVVSVQRHTVGLTPPAMLHLACAAIVIAKQALVRAIGSSSCNSHALLRATVSEISAHHRPPTVEIGSDVPEELVSDWLPVAWWLAVLALQTAVYCRRADELPFLNVSLTRSGKKSQLVAFERNGNALMRAVQTNTSLLEAIRCRLGAAQHMHAGPWGAMVWLRMPSSLSDVSPTPVAHG